ncbi:MAG: hypothetical protein KGZ86_04220 [Candidatus Latescibacteria bacterium]|nr:hypothetical protein [Candidatus Latescibacterota bacterium]
MSKNIILLSLILFFNIGTAQENLNGILAGVFRNEDKTNQEIQDAIFDGEFFYMEKNNKDQVVKTINSKRRIYTKGADFQKSEYSEMWVNGKLLSEEEMRKEMKKSRGDMQTKLPFSKPFRDNYDFSFQGEETWNGKTVWKIGYEPKQKGKDNIQGFAYVLQSDTNIVQYQFVPTGLPFVLKNFNIVLDYSKIDKYWVPVKFQLDMELDVKVLISFTHKFIRMEEQYSNYKFNNGLTDDFFNN